MTFLFRSGSLRDKITWILRATYTHSKNLATFVLIYKTLMAIMRRVEGQKGSIHPFLSAFIGGYFVFGTHDKINEQVNLQKNFVNEAYGILSYYRVSNIIRFNVLADCTLFAIENYGGFCKTSC